ncbi:MAG TPA: hypothetical protein VFI28_06845 [Candidatus Limnocylindrales bacterium]|nr:hypothetical protein [Candidatus Limnocylindrales bacterium]
MAIAIHLAAVSGGNGRRRRFRWYAPGVIVVIGSPTALKKGKRIWPAGRSVTVADMAHAGGAEVQLVGKVGDDLAGDAIVIELGRRGIGHSALARSESGLTPSTTAPAEPDDEADTGEAAAAEAAAELAQTEPPLPGLALEAADVKLALGYLPEISTIVVAAPLDEAAAKVVVDSAEYHEASLIVLVEPGTKPAKAFGRSIVLQSPAGAGEVFDRLVGAFAARIDGGAQPGDALRDVVASGGWERTAD